ncbi:MAG: proline dehydrogenase family protein [Acidimicrobiia bacterium]
MLRRLVLAVTGWSPIRRIFTERRWGRAVAGRFVAGGTLDDAVAAAIRLNREGAAVSLNHLGEYVMDPTEARRARDHYLVSLDRIRTEGLDANISVKLTQLGLVIDAELAAQSLRSLAQAAAEAGTTITIDMEDSSYTQATVDLFAAVQREFGNLGVALQAYLRRTEGDLTRLAPLGGHLRLCKGAYKESRTVAFQRRRQVDAAFDRLLGTLMSAETTRPAVATHHEGRIVLAKRLERDRGGPFEFQMLYGVRSRLQRELIAEGYPLRVYLPYGVNWYPYLTRRIAERPANLRFFVRALLGR